MDISSLLILIFTAITRILQPISARNNIMSPCSSIFQYEKMNITSGDIIFPSLDHPLWRGLVTVPVMAGEKRAQLKLILTVPSILPTKYSGKIEVLGDKSRLMQGDLAYLKYLVKFPKGITHLPYVKKILFNGRVICNGVVPPSPLQTKLVLEHNLFPLKLINLLPRIGHMVEPEYGHQPAASMICGSFKVNNPIVGGQPASLGEFPWLVPIFIQVNNTEHRLKFFCSGTLVDDSHIISAAHCFRQVHEKHLLVAFVGKYNIFNWTESDEEHPRGIKKIIIHPDFDPKTLYSDVAILKLEQPVVWKRNVAPACLWSGSDSLDLIVGKQGRVAGWGTDDTSRIRLTAEPNSVSMPVVSQENCLRSSREFLYWTSNKTFCAGEKNGAGPCNGDSGGGFYILLNGRWYLRGVVSLSLLDSTTQRCDLHQYVIFSDVAKFRLWIKETLR